MSNKVSIFITNTKNETYEFSNNKMSIMMVKDLHIDLKKVFQNDNISPYDIVLIDYKNNTGCIYGTNYFVIHKSTNEQESKYIIDKCREMLYLQYDKMMMIRIAKKYKLNETEIKKVEKEFYNKNNYEFDINQIFKK